MGRRGRGRSVLGLYIPPIPQGQKPHVGLVWPPYEKFSLSLVKAFFAEFVCTSLFIFVATGSVVFGCHSSDVASKSASTSGTVVAPEDCFLSNSRVLTIATSFGWTIATLVFISASFSGGHLNPAITLAFAITKKITLLRAFGYWISQLAGAILGSSFVYAVDRTGWHAAKGATNRLLPGISAASGWLMETLLTLLLVFTVLAATDASRAKISTHLPILAPFAIGLAVFVSHLAAVAIDGCSINPARSFGPAVVSGIWIDQWIFWVGPMSGAVLAAGLYEFFLRPSGEMTGTPKPFMKRTDSPDDVMEKGELDSPKSLDPMMPAGNTTPGQAHTAPLARVESDGVAVRGTGLPTFAGVRGTAVKDLPVDPSLHAPSNSPTAV